MAIRFFIINNCIFFFLSPNIIVVQTQNIRNTNALWTRFSAVYISHFSLKTAISEFDCILLRKHFLISCLSAFWLIRKRRVDWGRMPAKSDHISLERYLISTPRISHSRPGQVPFNTIKWRSVGGRKADIRFFWYNLFICNTNYLSRDEHSSLLLSYSNAFSTPRK